MSAEGEAAEVVRVERGASLREVSRGGPVDRRELEEAMLGPRRQEAEEVADVRPRLDAAEAAAGEQRREQRVDGAALVAADEEPVLAPTASRRSASSLALL